jgi:hypothetical protein
MREISRCPECEEPEFMCECAKNFRGEVIREVYHQGIFIGAKQFLRRTFFLEIKKTVIIGQLAYLLVSPDRHFGSRSLKGARV